MISAEPNSFDKYLKDHLPREVFAKLCLRTIISLSILLLAGTQPGFSFYDHLQRTADTVDMPIRVLAPLILLLSIYALMFKDLEHAFPEKWSQETAKGGAGAFVRSVSAELLLWMASIFFTLAIVVAIIPFALPLQDLTADITMKVFAILLYLIIFIAFFSSGYLLVKRNHPPLADSERFTKKFNSPRKVAAFYCANTLFVVLVYAIAT